MKMNFTVYDNQYSKEPLKLAVFPEIPFWFVFKDPNDEYCLSKVILELFNNLFIEQQSIGSPSIFKAIDNKVIVVIEATRKCNLYCRHCYLGAGKTRANELSVTEFKYVFAEIFNYYSSTNYEVFVWVMGGEPFCRPDILEILNIGLSYGFKIGIVTNGTLIDDNIASVLANLNVTVAVSIDGMENFHNWLRGRGAFDRTIQALNIMSKSGVKLDVNYVLCRENLLDLEQVADLVYKIGVNTFSINDLALVGRLQHDINSYSEVIHPLPYAEYFKSVFHLVAHKPYLLETLRDSHIGRVIASVVLGLKREPILFSKSNIYIASDGTVFPGNYWASIPKMNLGNIRTASLTEIIEEADHKFVGIGMRLKCTQCDVRYYCAGGRLSEIIANSKFSGKDDEIFTSQNPRCEDLHQGFIYLMWLIAHFPQIAQ